MTADELARRRCVPCEGGTPPLAEDEARRLLAALPGWSLEGGHLVRSYRFKDFKAALAFANRVGAIAEEEGHHPDLLVAWGKVRIELWTHDIGGLSENDFILAAKIDALSH
jgi:4a-hydroxytetrahydrobiopterin dehydratase